MTATARITHDGKAIRIDVTTNAGTFRGLRLDGDGLVNPAGKRIAISHESAEIIRNAIPQVVPLREEVLSGGQVSELPEDQRKGFEWVGMADNGVIGLYSRVTPGRDVTVSL